MSAAILMAAAVLLAASAATHLRHPSSLRAALRAHRVLPPGMHRPVSVILPVVQIVAALAGVTVAGGVILGGEPPVRAATGGLVAALYAAYAAYLWRAWSTAPAAGRAAIPCGCGLGESGLSGWQVTRAVLLALGCALAALTGGAPLPAGPAESAVAVAAAIALALVLAVLPGLRERPVPVRGRAGAAVAVGGQAAAR